MSGNVIAVLLSGILAALISAGVTVSGWRVVKRTQEREADLRHLQRQMEELYGPLLGLLHQQGNAYNIVTKLVPIREGGHPDIPNFTDEQRKTWNFFADKYLIPIQTEISNLLWGKIYLLNSTRLPTSFEKFIANATQFEYLHRLAEETCIPSLHRVSAAEWPEDFRPNVEETLASLKKQYDKLHHGR